MKSNHSSQITSLKRINFAAAQDRLGIMNFITRLSKMSEQALAALLLQATEADQELSMC